MDNEALVDQIVRSLSFEVVAAPQHVIPIDSSSKTTPVNVKIKVRKKQGAGLRHGVISMPQVDTRSDNIKQEPRDRIRLVSSDHTIMDFDVFMEAEFDKGTLGNQKKQNLNIIAPESLEQDRTDNQMNASPIFAKRNKDIFGKCKPGGCLDPPFGEDRYPYQQTKQNLSQQCKDDSRLRNSSIFKNNIFKKKRKSSQDDTELDRTDPGNRGETDSNLHETGSLTQHSNPLITYPHPSVPKKVQKQDDRRLSKEDDKNKRNSFDEKSRSSSIDEGSYYVIPKKSKRTSNQSDTQDKPDTKPDGAIITNLKCGLEDDDVNVTEIKPASPIKDSKFIPIPLIVPQNVLTCEGDENVNKPIVNVDHFKDTSETVSDKNVLLEPETKPDSTKKENESGTNINDNFSENVAPTEKSAQGANRAVFLNAPLDESHDAEKTQCAINDDKDLEGYSKSEIDPKSHPLLPDAREKSIIGITDSLNKKPENKDTLTVPVQNHNLSSANLKEIWENTNDPLKSTADVIFCDNIPNDHEDSLKNDQTSIISTNSEKNMHDKVAENVKPGDNFSPKETLIYSENEPVTDLESKETPQLLDDSQTQSKDNQTSYICHKSSDDYVQEPSKNNSDEDKDKQPPKTKSPSDIEEDKTKLILNEPFETTNSEDETVTIENMIDLKKVQSASDLSIMGSIDEKDPIKPKCADKDTTTKSQTNTETSRSFKLDQPTFNDFSDAFSRTTDNLQIVQPPSILKKGFWKMDIALQSYIDENNERILKSFDSRNAPQRQANDSVLIAQCYLGSDVNEIKIPVDCENDLNVKIAQNDLELKTPATDTRQDFVDTPRKRNITIDAPVSASSILDSTNQTKPSKSDASCFNDGTRNNDVRNALNKVYEEELLPLQDLIKGLREEIDMLVSYQIRFKESQRVKPIPKRARPVRLQANKKCSCSKKL